MVEEHMVTAKGRTAEVVREANKVRNSSQPMTPLL